MKEVKNDNIEFDFSKIKEKFVPFYEKHKIWFVFGILAFIVLLGFYSRVQNVPNLNGQYLISPDDPYFFFRQSSQLAEEGSLPDVDTLRYYPDGVSTKRESMGSVYLAAFSLNTARMINPDLTMYDVAAWFAPILFAVSLIIFFFFVKEIFKNDWLALLATSFFAFSPAILFRTAAGFLEKEPIFMPLFLISMWLFIKAYTEKDKKKLAILAGFAGIFTGLTGFSSGLFVFAIIYVVLLAVMESVLNKVDSNKFTVYAIWFFLMLITLLALTTKYGTITTFYKSLQLQIAGVGFVFAGAAALVPRPKKLKKIPNGVYNIAVAVLILIILGIVFLGPQLINTVQNVSSRIMLPSGESRMGLSVSENQPPTFLGGGRSWMGTFGPAGLMIYLFYIGAVWLFYNIFSKFKSKYWLTALYALMLLSLMFENFSNDPSYAWVNSIFQWQILYMALFAGGIIAFLFLERGFKEINSKHLFILLAFTITTIAANGAVRLFYMLAFSALILSAYFVVEIGKFLDNKINNFNISGTLIFIGFLIVFLPNIPLIGISGTASVAIRSNAAIYPRLSDWYTAMDWIRTETPKNSVFTHWWDYGYLIQAKGERTTVVDPGNFYAQRNYDTGGHLFSAPNSNEVLSYLEKYGNPNYWLVCSEDVMKFYQIARLGALADETTEGRESYFAVYSLTNQQTDVRPNNLAEYKEYTTMVIFRPITTQTQVLTDFRVGNEYFKGEQTLILEYILLVNEQERGPLLAKVGEIRNGQIHKIKTYPITCICMHGMGCFDLNTTGVPTCALPYEGGFLNIPYKTKDTLFVNAYILDKEIPGINKVFETSPKLDLTSILGHRTNVKIYEFNYDELRQDQEW